MEKPYLLIIITGVSGSGKTTLGNALSKTLKLPFLDGDAYHSEKNIEKMETGTPLEDLDRIPWLKTLAQLLKDSKLSGGCILACSALKESYRAYLQIDSHIRWIHLIGTKELLLQRLIHRENHYMKASMLDSQLATWEEPVTGLKISIAQSSDKIYRKALSFVKS